MANAQADLRGPRERRNGTEKQNLAPVRSSDWLAAAGRHDCRTARYCTAANSNRWPNSAPEYFVILREEDKADVTTIRKNLSFLRAWSTSPAVMMKQGTDPRTPFTSTSSTTSSLEHSRSKPHLWRSTVRTDHPSRSYSLLTARIAAASTSLFSSGSPNPAPAFDCLALLGPLGCPSWSPGRCLGGEQPPEEHSSQVAMLIGQEGLMRERVPVESELAVVCVGCHNARLTGNQVPGLAPLPTRIPKVEECTASVQPDVIAVVAVVACGLSSILLTTEQVRFCR
jgi:hypothetical protein